jgi:amino acid adenylation domain-containing protein
VTAKFDLSMTVGDTGGDIAVALEYAGALFDAATAQRYLGYWRRLLQGMVDSSAAIGRLPLLDAQEHAALLDRNPAPAALGDDVCLDALFERQVALTPAATALSAEQGQLSYAELNAEANRLAHYLIDACVGPDTVVALWFERSAAMVIAMLAVLKAGGAYLPLDTGMPAGRVAQVLGDSRPHLLLTHAGPARGWEQQAAQLPIVDLNTAPWSECPAGNPPRRATPASLAYVIYTSGSTGQPKGVMIGHRAIVNHMRWMQQRFPLAPGEAVLQKTPCGFDASVWEFHAPLLNGGRLVLARQDGHRDAGYLAALMAREQVHTLQAVPLLLSMLLESGALPACRALRRVFCGGEALPAALAAQFRQQLPGVQLINLYGPTEATIDASYAVDDGSVSESGQVPIGAPVANMRMYVMDRYRQLQPAGVTGELYIAGAGLARGYLRQPGLTAERFVDDPFFAGERMYRTGDLGRWRGGAGIEFIGRNDFQVKIRGFRIELGEIEACLARLPAVRQVVVLAQHGSVGGTRLVAYYVAPAAPPELLRAHAEAVLPDYMVPAVFVPMTALPLTPNGKLDRGALPEPAAAMAAPDGAPAGALQEMLAQAWRAVLACAEVGVHDNFFQLGGNSLLIMKLHSRLAAQLPQLTVVDLFRYPTIAKLEHQLTAAAAPVQAPAQAPRDRSDAQQRQLALRSRRRAGQAG